MTRGGLAVVSGHEAGRLARDLWLASLGLAAATAEQGGIWLTDLVAGSGRSGLRPRALARRTAGLVEVAAAEVGDRLRGALTGVTESILDRVGVPSRSEVRDLTVRVERLGDRLGARRA